METETRQIKRRRVWWTPIWQKQISPETDHWLPGYKWPRRESYSVAFEVCGCAIESRGLIADHWIFPGVIDCTPGYWYQDNSILYIEYTAVILHQFWVKTIFPWKFIWNTVVPLLSYWCMFQVEICSQQLEICKSCACFSSSPLLWKLINFRLFCSDDCRSLPCEQKSFGPMIADQEKINGCVRFVFQLSPFFQTGCQK